jgi:hypothetical protein
MKKKLIAILFFFILNGFAWTNQIKVFAGINLNKYLFSGEINSVNHKQKMGLSGGFGYMLDINDKIILEIDACFSQKGTKTSIAYTPDKVVSGIYNNMGISFPILCIYSFKQNPSLYVGLGPELGFIISHHLKIEETDENFNLKNTTKKVFLGFNALVGYSFVFKKTWLFTEIRFNHSFSNLLIDFEATVKNETLIFLIGGIFYL